MTEHLLSLQTPESETAYIQQVARGAQDPARCSAVLQSLVDPAPSGINVLTDGEKTVAILDLNARRIQVSNRRAFEALYPCGP